MRNSLKYFKHSKIKDANGNGDPTDEIPFGSGNFDPTFSYILPFNNRLGADNTYECLLKMATCISRTEKATNKGLQQCMTHTRKA